MADFIGDLTDKGLDLKTRADMGNGLIQLKFTRLAVGSGKLEEGMNYLAFDGLICPETDLLIIEFQNKGNGTSAVTGRLSNENLSVGFHLYEVGVFAIDPSTNSEILYQYIYTESPDWFPAFTTTKVNTKFKINTITGRTKNVTAVVDDSMLYVGVDTFDEYIELMGSRAGSGRLGYDNRQSRLEADNVQSALDELKKLHDELDTDADADQWYPVDKIIAHNLQAFPSVIVMEVTSGFGTGGFGAIPFGGGSNREIKSLVTWINRNELTISLEEKFEGECTLEQLNAKDFMLHFPDRGIGLFVQLFTNAQGIITDDGEGNVVLIEDIVEKLSSIERCKSHITEKITNEQGEHGIRFFEDKLEYFDGTAWIEIITGGFPVGNSAEKMIQFFSIPGASGKIRLKIKKPLDATGVMIRYKTTQWTVSDNTSAGTLVANIIDDTDYNGANKWYEVDGLTDGMAYYFKAFPVIGSTILDKGVGENETRCKAGGLYVEYTGDSLSGSTLLDTSGNERHGTIINAVVEKSIIGDGVRGNGTNAYVKTVSIDLPNKTVCLFVKKYGSAGQVFAYDGSYAAPAGVGLKHGALSMSLSDGKISFALKGSGSGKEFAHATNEVAFYCGKHNGSNGKVRKNDEAWISMTGTNEASISGGPGFFAHNIGSSTGLVAFGAATIDQFRVFDRELDDYEVANLYNGGVGC